MLGFRLFVAADTLGALDLYGYRSGAFDEGSRAFGAVLAAHAAMALAGAQHHQHGPRHHCRSPRKRSTTAT
jgi:hypothetical protein